MTGMQNLPQTIRTAGCWLLLLLLAPSVSAQQYSYDGNRWYEIEVVVFSNENRAAQTSEQALRDTSMLGYLPRLRQLRPATASFQIDFAGDTASTNLAEESLAPSAPPEKGLTPAAGSASGYRLDDFSRDPFIALDRRSWGFSQELIKLQDAPEHRVLWHAVWRQPMQGSSQAPAILLTGGERYAEHNELEGSIRFSDNAGRVNMDLQLWLSSFTAGRRVRAETPWTLPPQPTAYPAEPGIPGDWNVAEVWQMNETKELRSMDFYYLDNPAFGVLLQLRPYVLPVKSSGNAEEDF